MRALPAPDRRIPSMPFRRTILFLLLLGLGAGMPRTATAAPAARPGLRAGLEGSLVQLGPEGVKPFRWSREPEIVALYFGAGWCAPCREFVPQLRAVYDALRAQGADTDLVFVSLDRTEGDMRRYLQRAQMPWPALDWRRLAHSPALRALAGHGPPNLVLVDRAGRVLASGWERDRYCGPSAVLKTWAELCAKNSSTPSRAFAISPSRPNSP